MVNVQRIGICSQESLNASARVTPAPPKDAWPSTPRGRTHTAAASVPPSMAIKSKFQKKIRIKKNNKILYFR